MFDTGAPLHGPPDSSNPTVTAASHTLTHTHAGDLSLAHEALGGGAAVTKVLIDLHSHRRGGGDKLRCLETR